MQLDVEEKTTKQIYVAPCLKCGCDEIQIDDYGYNAPNIGGGKCTQCTNEASASCDIFPKKETLANIWNAQNCKKTLTKNKLSKIATLWAEIHALSYEDKEETPPIEQMKMFATNVALLSKTQTTDFDIHRDGDTLTVDMDNVLFRFDLDGQLIDMNVGLG